MNDRFQEMSRAFGRLLRSLEEDPRFDTILAGSALLLGIYLRFANLPGSRFRWPDEYRSLHFSLTVPFFSLIYKIPQAIFGASMSTALCTSAAIGVACLVLTYLLGRTAGHQRCGTLAILLLAVTGTHVLFSRSAYPVVLQTFLLLASVLILRRWLRRGGASLLIAAGFLLACALLGYLPSYAFILALFLVLLFQMPAAGRSPRTTLLSLTILGGTVATVFVFSIPLVVFFRSGEFDLVARFQRLNQFSGGVEQYITKPHLFYVADIGHSFLETTGLPLLVFLVLGTLLSVLARESRNQYFVKAALIAAVIYILISFLELHTLAPRHLAFLLPFLCLGSAAAAVRIDERARFPIGSLLCLIVAGIAIQPALRSSQIDFKIDGLLSEFDRRGIERETIVTLVDLSDAGTRTLPNRLPGSFENYPVGQFVIGWEEVHRLYLRGEARHLLTSGLGTRARTGFGDLVLAGADPVLSRQHPYREFARTDPRLMDFELYDLSELLPDSSAPVSQPEKEREGTSSNQ